MLETSSGFSKKRVIAWLGSLPVSCKNPLATSVLASVTAQNCAIASSSMAKLSILEQSEFDLEVWRFDVDTRSRFGDRTCGHREVSSISQCFGR